MSYYLVFCDTVQKRSSLRVTTRQVVIKCLLCGRQSPKPEDAAVNNTDKNLGCTGASRESEMVTM